jgi:hypothetical protein
LRPKEGKVRFRERFNIETFIVAPGIAPAPLVFNDPPFPDAAQKPATNPVQTYHLGLWFNSPQDAEANGCPNGVTPFNGEHNAGIHRTTGVDPFRPSEAPPSNR